MALKVFSLATFKKAFRDQLEDEPSIPRRRLAFARATQRLYPAHVGTQLPTSWNAFADAQAKTLLPAGCYIYRYHKWGRWQITESGTERSRSFFGQQGMNHEVAFLELARWAWQRVLHRDALEILDRPVPGIFPPRTGNTDADNETIANFYVPP